jgi:hypothetical protein
LLSVRTSKAKGPAKMRTYRELASEFVDTLKRENAETRRQIDQIEATGMRISERSFGGRWSDVTDRELASLKARNIEP